MNSPSTSATTAPISSTPALGKSPKTPTIIKNGKKEPIEYLTKSPEVVQVSMSALAEQSSTPPKNAPDFAASSPSVTTSPSQQELIQTSPSSAVGSSPKTPTNVLSVPKYMHSQSSAVSVRVKDLFLVKSLVFNTLSSAIGFHE